MGSHKIYVIDDHPVVQAAMAGVVAMLPDCEFAGKAGSSREALAWLAENEVDLVISDFNMDGEDGFTHVRELKAVIPKTPVLLFTVSDEVKVGPRARREGASGLLMKGASISEITAAIQELLAGRQVFSHAVLNAEEAKNPAEVLTNRELQVLHLVGAGDSLKEVAAKMEISVKTAENHRENIKGKLKVSNAAHLQIVARDHYRSITGEAG